MGENITVIHRYLTVRLYGLLWGVRLSYARMVGEKPTCGNLPAMPSE